MPLTFVPCDLPNSPLAKKLDSCGVFGVSSDENLNYAARNRQEWEAKGRGVVAEYLEILESGDIIEEGSDIETDSDDDNGAVLGGSIGQSNGDVGAKEPVVSNPAGVDDKVESSPSEPPTVDVYEDEEDFDGDDSFIVEA